MKALLTALSSLSPETHQERRSIPSNLRILRNTHTHTHTHTRIRKTKVIYLKSCNILTNNTLLLCNSKLSLSLLSFTFYLYLNNNNKMATTPKDFTHLSAASIQTIAEAFGFVISDDVAKAFAPDVEYRLRDIIQEALKCTKRSRRNVLTTEVCFFMFLSLSFSQKRVFLSNIVEYILCSTLDDDDGYNASVVRPKRNTHTHSFLSFQFKSLLTLFCVNRT